MKIIFNSDLLFATSLIKDKLPRQVTEFLSACKQKGHEIVIPLTTLLEFDKKQSEFLSKEISNLQNAGAMLSKYDISVDDYNPKDLIKPPDLIQLIKDIGITCNLEEPTKDDYQSAHRRACLRESPHPPDIKSDEMRDLVIWEISIRIARENEGAILMSRDEVHTHYRGDKEASELKLIRCNSFERAYETLSIETISSKKVSALLDKEWNNIISSEFPVVDGGQVVSITRPIFKETMEGTSMVSCGVKFHSGDGKELTTLLNMEYVNDQPFKIWFRDIMIDENNQYENVSLEFEKPSISDKDFQDRLDNLKELIKG